MHIALSTVVALVLYFAVLIGIGGSFQLSTFN